jgi:glucose/arabinose dehydrogenase
MCSDTPVCADRQTRFGVRKRRFLPMLLWLTACLSVHATELPLQTQLLTVADDVSSLQVPSGTRLELLTTELDLPRLMTFLPNGDLLIGSKSGNVYRLAPPYREPQVLVKLPGYPHSLAYRDGELFIVHTDGLYRSAYRPGQRSIDQNGLELLAPLPAGGRSFQPQRGRGPGSTRVQSQAAEYGLRVSQESMSRFVSKDLLLIPLRS